MTVMNRRNRGRAVTVAALVATAVVATPAFAAVSNTAAVVGDNGDAFVRNAVVQAGAKANGTLGSSDTYEAVTAAVDAGFTSLSIDTMPGSLGLINDPGSDGFGVGKDHGDFFTPGDPYEAWGIFADGQLYANLGDLTLIEGGFQPVAGGVTNAVTWASDAPVGGISIEQTYSAPADNQRFIKIDVSLTNTTSEPQTVYYVRQVDPDNEVDAALRDDPDADTLYETFNSILQQGAGGQLVVGYSYYDNSVIGLQANDPNAVVRITGEDWALPFSEESVVDAESAAAAFASYASAFKVGYRDFLDAAIDIVVKREIAPGATSTLTFDYVVDRRALAAPHPDYALDLNLKMEVGEPYADVPALLAGGGLKPNSPYTLTEFSEPNLLFTGTTKPNGNFFDETALPTDCRPGSHTLVLAGIAPDNSEVSDFVTYTVDENCIVTAFDPYAAVNQAGGPDSENPDSENPDSENPDSEGSEGSEAPALAETGADNAVAMALGVAALVLTLSGAGFMVWTRRRNTRTS